MAQHPSDLHAQQPQGGWLVSAVVLGILILAAAVTFPRAIAVNANYLRLNHTLSVKPTLSDKPTQSEVNTRARLESALATYPSAGPLLRGRALLLSQQGMDTSSVSAWRSYPGGADEVGQWARRAEKSKDWEQAAHWYRLLTALEPKVADNWYSFGQVLLQLNRREAAVQAFQAGLSAPPGSQALASDFLTRLGELSRQGDSPDWNQALSQFTQAIEEDTFGVPGGSATAHMGRAEAADHLGQFSQSLADYRWVAARQPNNYWAHVHGGRLTWFVEQDAEQATALLEHAITIDPANKWAYLNLAQVYMESGQNDPAVATLEQVLALDPRNETARARLEQLQDGR